MKRNVLIDTGPLVAFLSRADERHAWVRTMLEDVEPPLRTCEAVLSEACFLLRRVPGGTGAVLELVARGLVTVPFRFDAEATAVRALLARYANVPMSFADACLVRMAELDNRASVLTLDGDFRVYRRNGRHVVPVLMPAG